MEKCLFYLSVFEEVLRVNSGKNEEQLRVRTVVYTLFRLTDIELRGSESEFISASTVQVVACLLYRFEFKTSGSLKIRACSKAAEAAARRTELCSRRKRVFSHFTYRAVASTLQHELPDFLESTQRRKRLKITCSVNLLINRIDCR